MKQGSLNFSDAWDILNEDRFDIEANNPSEAQAKKDYEDEEAYRKQIKREINKDLAEIDRIRFERKRQEIEKAEAAERERLARMWYAAKQAPTAAQLQKINERLQQLKSRTWEFDRNIRPEQFESIVKKCFKELKELIAKKYTNDDLALLFKEQVLPGRLERALDIPVSGLLKLDLLQDKGTDQTYSIKTRPITAIRLNGFGDLEFAANGQFIYSTSKELYAINRAWDLIDLKINDTPSVENQAQAAMCDRKLFILNKLLKQICKK